MWVDNADRRLLKATWHNFKSEIMETESSTLPVKSEEKEPDLRGISETNRIDVTWQLFGL